MVTQKSAWVFQCGAIAVAVCCSVAPSAWAAITNTQTTAAYTSPDPASATDLINAGQSTLTSASVSVTAFDRPEGGPYTYSVLNNGLGAESTSDPYNFTQVGYIDGVSFSATYTLNTTANPLGYDISKVQTISGWGDMRSGQWFDLWVSKVGTPSTFELIGTYTFSNNASSYVIQTLTNNGGGALSNGIVTASGVAAVKFISAPPEIGYGNGTMWREFDVFGGATVPEPAMLGLLALGGLALLRRRQG